MAAAVKETVSNLLDKITDSKPEGVPPIEPREEDVKELKEKYGKAGQDHVFTFYDSLDVAGKAALYDQLSGFNPDYINLIAKKALQPPKDESGDSKPKLEPLPSEATSSVMDSDEADLGQWYDQGLRLISESKVAVVLMAGGQGTRLGSSAPKGCFDIGLPSRKSLFQLQAERIWKVQHLAHKKYGKDGVTVPWYVMTSGPTRKPTEEFFEKNSYFGLQKENVTIFEQGVLPCISNDGKILMETKSKVWPLSKPRD